MGTIIEPQFQGEIVLGRNANDGFHITSSAQRINREKRLSVDRQFPIRHQVFAPNLCSKKVGVLLFSCLSESETRAARGRVMGQRITEAWSGGKK
jgi:hypothetical protein